MVLFFQTALDIGGSHVPIPNQVRLTPQELRNRGLHGCAALVEQHAALEAKTGEKVWVGGFWSDSRDLEWLEWDNGDKEPPNPSERLAAFDGRCAVVANVLRLRAEGKVRTLNLDELAYPPDKGLPEPKRDLSNTLSAFDVMCEHFFPPEVRERLRKRRSDE